MVSDAILALWFALIGADRVDLFGGNGPFILTPFLALTPIVVVAEVLRRYRQGHPVEISRRAVAYAAVAGVLVSLALASVFIAANTETSFSRVMLLVGDVAGTFTIALLCLDRPDLMRVLARGAIACLLVYAVFDVTEALWWIGRAPELVRFGTVTIDFSHLQNAGPYPRLAGPVADGNRGGFVLLFYYVVIWMGVQRTWARRAALACVVLLLLATVSRSATLGATAMLGMVALAPRRTVSPRKIFVGALLLACAAGVLLAWPHGYDALGRVLAPAAERVSTKEGSAPEHLQLIGRGLDEATASVDRTIRGLGYGDSYLVLQDIFPGNRYGNFHSLFVTMFAEAGVFALIATLVLVLTPLVIGGPLRTMIAGAIGFNLFYQTTTEPTFWFVLALAWMTLPVGPNAWNYGSFWTRRVASTLSPWASTMPSMKLDPRPSTME